MKKLKFLVFVIPFLFGFNVFAWDSISGSSYGYDEYTGVCQSNSFYYMLDNPLAQQGFGTFAYSYTNGNFARVRADINYQLLPNTTYDLTFSNPLHNYGSNPTYAWTAITTSSVSINIINGCGGTIMRPISVSSVSYPDSTVYDRDYVTIRFTTSDYVAKPWFSVDLQSGYTSQGIYQITTGGQARLDNIYISIVTGGDSGGSSSNQDIINNQTNNTNNIINNQNENTNNIINNQNENTDKILDDDVSSDTGTDFFDNFTNQDFGLSQIITIPLSTIQSLTSKSCVTLNVPIPFTNRNVQLPCMVEIYNKFPTIFNLWKIVSFGIISYFICIDIFHIVKGFKDPESDKVEVLDL